MGRASFRSNVRSFLLAHAIGSDAAAGDAYLPERGGSNLYMLAGFAYNHSSVVAPIRLSGVRPHVAMVRLKLRQIADGARFGSVECTPALVDTSSAAVGATSSIIACWEMHARQLHPRFRRPRRRRPSRRPACRPGRPSCRRTGALSTSSLATRLPRIRAPS